MQEDIKKLADLMEGSQNIVFFGGAGVSTESGIPDFRSVDGLYQQTYQYPPETILSHSFFKAHTKAFYDFYYDKMLCPQARPNMAHKYLVELEKEGKLRGIVTQNIDGLHQEAGSNTVFELHGSVHRNYCMTCHKSATLEELSTSYTCGCGGILKPDVVLYEEGLNDHTVEGAVKAIAQADLLVIAGTSLAVYPAASFVRYFSGKHLVVINKTPLDITCTLHIEGAVGEVFAQVKRERETRIQ